MENNHATVLQIDLNAVRFNLDHFKSKLSEDTKVLVVVKAFGYGSDAIEIAKSIQNKVSYFAVAYTKEGIALREAGIKTPILVLHPQVQNLQELISYDLEPNLYNIYILSAFLKLADSITLDSYPIHLKFNTGLNRLGFSIEDIDLLYQKLARCNAVLIKSIFSHLASSEDINEREFSLNQIEQFNTISAVFKRKFNFLPMRHMLNTSGVLNFPEAQFDLVRLGIGIYGFANNKEETTRLKNVISLKTIITQIHNINIGESVGYNRSFFATDSMKTATVAIGHADGISRRLGNKKGYVTINNQKAYIIGNVCMDMMMVDVTNIICKAGDEVIVFDNQQKVNLLATNSDTISYEILTAISQRVKRFIIN